VELGRPVGRRYKNVLTLSGVFMLAIRSHKTLQAMLKPIYQFYYIDQQIKRLPIHVGLEHVVGLSVILQG